MGFYSCNIKQITLPCEIPSEKIKKRCNKKIGKQYPYFLNDSFNPKPESNKNNATPVPPNGVNSTVFIIPDTCPTITISMATPRKQLVKSSEKMKSVECLEFTRSVWRGG